MHTPVDSILPIIQRMRIEQGDVLIVKGRWPGHQDKIEVARAFVENLPGVRVMVIPQEWELAVISKREASALADEIGDNSEHARMVEFFKRCE